MGTSRQGRPRRTAIAAVHARSNVCHLCELPIVAGVDSQRHPLRRTVDELLPVKFGGSTTDPANLAPACAICNSSRGAKPITPEVKARCRELSMMHRARLRSLNPRW